MKVTAQSTDRIVTLNGVQARIWEATTERGVPCLMAVTRIAVNNADDSSQFEQELQEQHAPAGLRAIEAFPLSMIL